MTIRVLTIINLGISAIAVAALFLWGNTQLKRKRLAVLFRKKEDDLERASRLLIEKNFELSDQNLRLEKLLEAKTDFVAIASHQLRTPITEIKWGLEIFLEGMIGPFSQSQRQHLTKILDSSKKMILLIDDLLRLVRIEAGYKEYSIGTHDIEQTLRKIAEEAHERFADKRIRLEYNFQNDGMTIPFDSEMIEIALANLIANAFHYTPADGTVRISTGRINDRVRIAIQDSGIGIPKDQQNDLFKKFQRSVMALEMNADGMGLGLYLAKNIIEQHRGKISFESEPGKGTTFFVTLPAS